MSIENFFRPRFLCLLLEPVVMDTSAALYDRIITAASDSVSIVAEIISCSFVAFVNKRLENRFICSKV